ncbi:hypothetical protein [Kribbella italica]|uniref:DNA-directed RNA polymerase specialized sigma24 family protein n=1 Tax=Kribbella italica TaxID=1540520 RepID=A0A7W9J1K2_9ACTN|nr:hypothetical protein [Kribbella italica]MBB5833382.1 DNA-directed RNA polymerase specialized sigma24 family protein [Kribbella italica]
MTYTREMVEQLLPMLWDPDAVWGAKAPQAPPQDMPRATPNKKEGNTLYAHLADMNTGWEKAELTLKERRAIFLHYGLDWSEKDVAYNQEISPQGINVRLFTGVGKLVAHLNGGEFTEAAVC